MKSDVGTVCQRRTSWMGCRCRFSMRMGRSLRCQKLFLLKSRKFRHTQDESTHFLGENMKKALATLGCLTLTWTLSAFSADAAGPVPVPVPPASNADHPCHSEIQKVCPKEKLGEGMGKCVHTHMKEFSPACQAKMSAMKDKVHSAMEACHADVQKLCGNVKRGGGRIVKCLKEHQADVSEPCKAKMAEWKD